MPTCRDRSTRLKKRYTIRSTSCTRSVGRSKLSASWTPRRTTTWSSCRARRRLLSLISLWVWVRRLKRRWTSWWDKMRCSIASCREGSKCTDWRRRHLRRLWSLSDLLILNWIWSQNNKGSGLTLSENERHLLHWLHSCITYKLHHRWSYHLLASLLFFWRPYIHDYFLLVHHASLQYSH